MAASLPVTRVVGHKRQYRRIDFKRRKDDIPRLRSLLLSTILIVSLQAVLCTMQMAQGIHPLPRGPGAWCTVLFWQPSDIDIKPGNCNFEQTCSLFTQLTQPGKGAAWHVLLVLPSSSWVRTRRSSAYAFLRAPSLKGARKRTKTQAVL